MRPRPPRSSWPTTGTLSAAPAPPPVASLHPWADPVAEALAAPLRVSSPAPDVESRCDGAGLRPPDASRSQSRRPGRRGSRVGEGGLLRGHRRLGLHAGEGVGAAQEPPRVGLMLAPRLLQRRRHPGTPLVARAPQHQALHRPVQVPYPRGVALLGLPRAPPPAGGEPLEVHGDAGASRATRQGHRV